MKRFTFFLIYLSWPILLLVNPLCFANNQPVLPWILLLVIIVLVIVFIYKNNHYNNTSISKPHPSTTPTTHTAPTTPTTNTPPTKPTSPASLPSSLFCENWQLLAFALKFGPTMQVGICHDSNDNPFHTIRFIKPDGTVTYVYFFSQLGVLSPSEISRRKHSLWIGRNENNRYYLYDEVREWEEVNLGI